jgi:glycosyl-4,4'-diaponeurosporenoate acyltransferase
VSASALLALNVGGWAAVQFGVGYVAHRLPLDRLQHDGWLLRVRAWERDGRAYRRLGIARWKDRLPEAGAFFEGGMTKRALPPGDRRVAVGRFAAETRRAELAHWFAISATPLFFVWNPLAGMIVCVVYALAANLPCVIVQRYNRARAERVLLRPPLTPRRGDGIPRDRRR